jgi:alpha-L-fucosidase
VRRWRWRVTRLKGEDLVGEWQDSAADARQDALRAGVVKHDREHGWFFDVFTQLEREDDADT